MILLLDANVVYWAIADPEQLAAGAREAIASPANDAVVSAASVWELEIKRLAGKLRLDAGLLETLEQTPLPVIAMTDADAVAAAALPMHHRDPFDRMLVAQARRLGAAIVSRDGIFDAYGVDRLAA